MAYAVEYRPGASSLPSAEVAEGDRRNIALEDTTPDGGTGLTISQTFSGRRVLDNTVPKRVRWLSNRKLLDYENAVMKTVSSRFRGLIEAIEPGVHQFVPVAFVAKDGSPLAQRWFWQVCNRLDSVHREKTNWELRNGTVWFPPKSEEPRLIFDTKKIGTAKFWHDKHHTEGPMITDDVKAQLEQAGMTGIHYHHYEDA